MQDKFEKLIKVIYKKLKADSAPLAKEHPDEEDMVCFLENRLSAEESERIKIHLINCRDCSQKVAAGIKLETVPDQDVPQDLLKRVKDLVAGETKISFLEIILRLKEKALEILSTTGDVLVGQELVPAPVLRSRNIKDFQDVVTILKDFQDIRVEAKIENKGSQAFSLSIVVKEKATQEVMRDLRVTLIRDDLELESYLSGTGRVTFEHVLIGKYTVEISNLENKVAAILLEIKV